MPRPRPMPSAALVSAALLAAACSTTVAIDQPHVHEHTTAITITDAGVLPQPNVTIPILSTVVWRNRTSAPVSILVDMVTCGGCDTVLGFASCTEGARCKSIAPGDVATLCFHSVGTFGYEVRAGEAAHRGEIHVDAPR